MGAHYDCLLRPASPRGPRGAVAPAGVHDGFQPRRLRGGSHRRIARQDPQGCEVQRDEAVSYTHLRAHETGAYL
eukprot:1265955-Pyramimonas_sp.AAC.1